MIMCDTDMDMDMDMNTDTRTWAYMYQEVMKYYTATKYYNFPELMSI
jgi:hypothetical protein